MKTIHIDIETYSGVSLEDCGVYRYAEDPSFQLLLFAYAINDEPVEIIDVARGEELSASLINALLDPGITKVAHNAAFERVCLSNWLRRLGFLGPGQWLDPRGWRCTMAQATECGLPASLAEAGKELGLTEQKMKEGKGLIRVFCVPGKARTGLFGSGARTLPEDRPEDWEMFKAYCRRDVEVEREIDRATIWVAESDRSTLRQIYALDQAINDRGVLVDTDMASQAVTIDAMIRARLTREAASITGLDNPNSVAQLKEWIGGRTGGSLDRLRKEDLSELSGSTDDPDVRRVLQIRAEMGKTSCAKYAKMLDAACSDGRVRGMLLYYGSRTGRWSGRLLQPQNLPQNHLATLDFARGALRDGDIDTLELCYGNVPNVMSQLIRTVLVAPEDRTFAVCDFSAIEARVLAWLAGEDWVLDVFREGGDIYCATASQMFHVPVEKHGRNAELRQKGKIAVLALGYGGGTGALEAMGGAKLGMTESEMKDTVKKWRDANPHICRLWREVDKAAKSCVIYRTACTVGKILFHMHDDTLVVTLPSGRQICYAKMKIDFENDWAYLDQTAAQRAAGQNYIVKEKKSLHPEKYAFSEGQLTYRGTMPNTKQWGWVRTFGGKLVENITQAVARDCLAEVMWRLEHKHTGMPVVFHVHDEVIVETSAERSEDTLKAMMDEFSQNERWNEGLPLKGAGFVTPYYMKD